MGFFHDDGSPKEPFPQGTPGQEEDLGFTNPPGWLAGASRYSFEEKQVLNYYNELRMRGVMTFRSAQQLANKQIRSLRGKE